VKRQKNSPNPGRDRSTPGDVRDVSERKRMEEAARTSAEKLRHVEKLEALERMAGGAAHEFNNLLTMVMGYAALMLSALDSRETLIDNVEQISTASKRAAAITHELLAFSGHQFRRPEELDLNAVVNGAREFLPRLVGRKITVAIEPAAQPLLIHADRAQMQQILLNLANNARDAMPRGGTLTIRTAGIKLEGKDLLHNPGLAAGDYAELVVADTGVGIPADVQPHLFEPFFSTKEVGKGAGLGLAAVHGVVQQSGGTIVVESAPGAGTTFRVLLPQLSRAAVSSSAAESPPLSPRAAEMAPAAEIAPASMNESATILVVDDVASLREMMRGFLDKLGYNVLEAADGEEAVQKARDFRGRIDLLLTDVKMTGMTGREAADDIRRLRSDIKVLYISGYIEDAFEKEEAAGPNDVLLEKPFTFEELAARVRAVLSPGAGAATMIQ
jgi:two-component system cell cycle sensor histidine kinase/response regulator CckA